MAVNMGCTSNEVPKLRSLRNGAESGSLVLPLPGKMRHGSLARVSNSLIARKARSTSRRDHDES